MPGNCAPAVPSGQKREPVVKNTMPACRCRALLPGFAMVIAGRRVRRPLKPLPGSLSHSQGLYHETEARLDCGCPHPLCPSPALCRRGHHPCGRGPRSSQSRRRTDGQGNRHRHRPGHPQGQPEKCRRADPGSDRRGGGDQPSPAQGGRCRGLEISATAGPDPAQGHRRGEKTGGGSGRGQGGRRGETRSQAPFWSREMARHAAVVRPGVYKPQRCGL